MKKYMNFYAPALALIVGLLLAACAGQVVQPQVVSSTPQITPTPTPGGRGSGGILRILNPEAPTILNPHLSNSLKDWEPGRITYEPLASVDKESNLIPVLAAEIPTLENGGLAEDRKSVTWKLRQDVKWSDGEPFTADDVLFTYQYITNPDVKASTTATYSAVESVEVIDPYTIKVNFKQANPAWILPFVGIQGAIIPRHVFEPFNGANAREAPANTLPVGTGPYHVILPGIKPQEVLLLGTQLVQTNKIIFEPNPYFREADKPFFSQVEWRGGGTPNEAARLVLQDGGIDYASFLGQLPSEKETELGTEQGRLVTDLGATVDRIILNRTDPNRSTADGERSSLSFPHPFFSDKKVRQAFAHAIDRQAIATLYGSIGQPTTNNLVAPPEYNSPNTFYEFDLEKAKQLLDEAGWRDTNSDGILDKAGSRMKVVFQTYVGTTQQRAQEVVKESLESLGIEVELKIVDSSIMFGPGAANPDSIRRFNADLQEFIRTSNNPDPGSYMQLWTCGQIPQKANNWSGANYERWCNPEYDALNEQAATELDPEKRRQLFIQMNDMLIEDVVMIPVIHLDKVQGVAWDIEGVNSTPWDMNTWNIKDWRRTSP